MNLPDTYQQVELTVQEQQYPAWSDPMAPRYYVLNALNVRTGETHLYQYDTDDGTYQYFIAPDQEEESVAGLPIPGKVGEVINNHLSIFFAVMLVLGLILFILMIMFAVKLVHRNQELDDLYDEYDIPFDDEDDDDQKSQKKPQDKASDDYDDDDSDDSYDDDDYDDDYDDDDYDDDYDEDEGSTTQISDKKRPEEQEAGRRLQHRFRRYLSVKGRRKSPVWWSPQPPQTGEMKENAMKEYRAV